MEAVVLALVFAALVRVGSDRHKSRRQRLAMAADRLEELDPFARTPRGSLMLDGLLIPGGTSFRIEAVTELASLFARL